VRWEEALEQAWGAEAVLPERPELAGSLAPAGPAEAVQRAREARAAQGERAEKPQQERAEPRREQAELAGPEAIALPPWTMVP
jgi:hypothetical protein